ncbi:MAG TPA: type II secretion system F family protein [Tepidisphaeraceae bacterium]|nr:type II secretion system F family protein [Tepidisphaeraceae bacterium]
MSEPNDFFRLLIQGSVFTLVVALWLVAVIIWYLRRSRRTERIHQRIGLGDGAADEERVLRLWRDGEMLETSVRGEAKPTLLQRLERVREDAGWTIPMLPILAGLIVIILLFAVVLYVISGNLLLPGIVALLLLMIFRGVLQMCINKRAQVFEKQLVDALDLGARSLRAGHPLGGAFQLIAREVPAPVGALFESIGEQEALGVSVQESLQRVAAESHSPDMTIFAASVVIQMRSGGNLADMIERVAWVIRERMRLGRRARVLAAEAQMSKWVLMALPLGLFLALNVLNPQYVKTMYVTTAGNVMLAISAVGLMIGSYVMGRMAKLKY